MFSFGEFGAFRMDIDIVIPANDRALSRTILYGFVHDRFATRASRNWAIMSGREQSPQGHPDGFQSACLEWETNFWVHLHNFQVVPLTQEAKGCWVPWLTPCKGSRNREL